MTGLSTFFGVHVEAQRVIREQHGFACLSSGEIDTRTPGPPFVFVGQRYGEDVLHVAECGRGGSFAEPTVTLAFESAEVTERPDGSRVVERIKPGTASASVALEFREMTLAEFRAAYPHCRLVFTVPYPERKP